eukprot:3940524-Rhodomonas_salina.2
MTLGYPGSEGECRASRGGRGGGGRALPCQRRPLRLLHPPAHAWRRTAGAVTEVLNALHIPRVYHRARTLARCSTRSTSSSSSGWDSTSSSPCDLPYTLHPTPYTLHPTHYTLHPRPYTLHPTPSTLHPPPYTLHPTPYTRNPTPYTLHPTPSIHPTPYTLHLTFYTRDPKP